MAHPLSSQTRISVGTAQVTRGQAAMGFRRLYALLLQSELLNNSAAAGALYACKRICPKNAGRRRPPAWLRGAVKHTPPTSPFIQPSSSCDTHRQPRACTALAAKGPLVAPPHRAEAEH